MQIQPPDARILREHALQAAWRGRSYHALVQAFGEPLAIFSIPGYRPLRTNMLFYGVRDKTSNCIDAFTVVVPHNSAELIIEDYFCR